MRYIKKFESFDSIDIKNEIIKKYKKEDVISKFKKEIENWVSDKEDSYQWYLDHNNGEAQDVVISNLIDEYKRENDIKLTNNERDELYNSLIEYYDI